MILQFSLRFSCVSCGSNRVKINKHYSNTQPPGKGFNWFYCKSCTMLYVDGYWK